MFPPPHPTQNALCYTAWDEIIQNSKRSIPLWLKTEDEMLPVKSPLYGLMQVITPGLKDALPQIQHSGPLWSGLVIDDNDYDDDKGRWYVTKKSGSGQVRWVARQVGVRSGVCACVGVYSLTNKTRFQEVIDADALWRS